MSQITANTVWECEVGGSDSNGGGFDSTTSGAGTDYSQQTSAQATGTATSASTTVTATTSIFTSQMVGNYITDGTNWYLITGYTSALIVTVNAAPSWTVASVKVGGCLATPTQMISLLQTPGNVGWLKAGTYQISSGITFPSIGYSTLTRLIGYDTVRGDAATKPIIQATAGSITMLTAATSGTLIHNVEIDGNGQSSVTGVSFGFLTTGISGSYVHGCSTGISGGIVYGCEVASNTTYGIYGTSTVDGCYVHGNGIGVYSSTTINDSIIYDNSGLGVFISYGMSVVGCTIYGNGTDGIQVQFLMGDSMPIANNIIYGNGGYGLNDATGLSLAVSIFDYNAYGANTSGNINNGPYGTHDVLLSGDPCNNASGGDFGLNTTAGRGAACVNAGYPGKFPGTTTTGYASIGAVQPQVTSATITGLIRNPPLTGGTV